MLFYCVLYNAHKTCNMVESMNNVFQANYKLSILDLLNKVWRCSMG